MNLSPRALVFFILLVSLSLTSSFAFSPLDNDKDGYPDVVEFRTSSEKRAFREWFAAIAEAQFTAPAPDWTYRDCSGLLRYAFVEALKPKDSDWFAKFPFLRPPTIASPSRVSYPMAGISRSVFRIAEGSYQLSDVEQGRMVGLATAAELMRYSSVPLGKQESSAQRGDLLFFVHPLAEGSSYHSLIYLGNGMVVYHTGASPEEGGEVRLLSLDTLRKHPDPSWHPDANNPNFLGFYRWKILD
ncbi:MAG: DUF1175 family protein [Trueperaceae bacterium]|nr:DUF1175 family protein [Trueperaceae bacterium]